jgi:NDP-sugar pyrophosphorylase family protein
MKQSDVTTVRLIGHIPDSMKCLFEDTEYPWDVLNNIGEYIKSHYVEYLKQGYKEYKPGVLVGNGTKIAESAFIDPLTIIGPNCEIRHCAYIRGNVITGEKCVIGNSTEVKNSVLFDHVQIPHFNYVGDSILGNRSHLGAGAVCSNVRQDKATITIKTEPPISTNRQKLGAIICDDVEIGCGSVINPGTIIGSSSRIYPLTSLRGIIEENRIVKSTDKIIAIQ